MIATELRCPSWQGRNLKLSFQPANLIVGDPFSGKSAITSAIRLGMYGIIAQLGKEHSATFKPCSDDKELFCRLTFDNGKTNSVTINRDSEGRFSKSMDLQVAFPDVMMDVGEYFKLTGQRQLAYVLERVDLKKMGYDENALLNDMQSPENGNDAVIKEWWHVLTTSVEQRNKQERSLCSWMDEFINLLKSSDKNAKATVKTQQAVVDAFRAQDEPKDVSKEREAAMKALQEAKLAAVAPTDSNNKRQELINQRVMVERDLNYALDEIDDIDHEIAKMKKLDHCPTCLNEGKDWLKTWLKKQQAKRKAQNDGVAELKKRIAELEKQIAVLEKKTDEAKTKKLAKAVSDAEDKYATLDAQYLDWKVYQQNKDAVTKAKEKIAQAEAEQVVIKHMKTQLEKHQQQLAEKAFTHLLKIARKFTDGILNSPLEYRDGDFGRRVSEQDRRMGMDAPVGRWIAHEVFSGTEKLLVYAGLQISLCQNSPAKILVFDEMQRTGNKREAIARRLLELVKDGTLSQFFLVDNETEPFGLAAREINVIRV